MSDCRALYVHIPFCRSICGYCDFYSEVLRPEAVRPLVDALLAELERATRGRDWRFDTVFIGGGTPTVLPAGELDRLLGAIEPWTDLSHGSGAVRARDRMKSGPTGRGGASDRMKSGPTGMGSDAHPTEFTTEFTVEANPATVTEEIAAVLARGGVNRVSMGAQSFVEDELRVLQRTHRPEQVAETVAICRAHGLSRLSLDLMFGIPGQTPASWQTSLAAALALEPEHLSCYGLTYEPGTPLHGALQRGDVQALDPDLEADLYESTIDTLAAAGLPRYEISNYARPGAECRHNLRYWHNEPYLGLGPAAAGFIEGVRYKNIADTAAYVAVMREGGAAWAEMEELPAAQRARETAMLELRLVEGMDRVRFAERYDSDPAELFAEAIAKHAAVGLVEVTVSHVRLTRRGMMVANRVLADFLE